MSQIVKVKLWGRLIGLLAYAPEQSSVASFEYDSAFLENGVSPSPLKLPLNPTPFAFDNISQRTFHGLPGFIADALPDKFGNQLIDQYFALKGRSSDEITALDRLLYIGNRAMGGLEFEPSEKFKERPTSVALDITMLSELAELVLTKKEEFAKKLSQTDMQSAIELLRIGSSAGGARSKALVARDENGVFYDGTLKQPMPCRYYMLKFDSKSNSDRDNEDPKGMTRVEYVYSLIAKECGINMPYTSFVEIGEDFHFLIERFDRINNGKTFSKRHYVSWAGIDHSDRDVTGAYSYEQLVMVARQLGLGQNYIEEIFRRAVFNIVGKNQDDHTKNFGFLMNKDGSWELSPAFDMTYAYDPTGKWTRNHQIRLNQKQTDFTKEDIVTFGKYCNLNAKESIAILEKTCDAFYKFGELANKYQINGVLKDTIFKNLRLTFGEVSCL